MATMEEEGNLAANESGNQNEMANNGENLANSTTMTKDRNLTAFIPLKNNHLLDKTTTEIIQSLCKENPKELHPLYAFKYSNAIKLVYPSKESRDAAIKRHLSIFNLRVELEMPYEPTIYRKKTLHLYGINVDEKSSDVEAWLKSLGVQVVSEMRWLHFKETEVRNGGRSYVISVPINKELPGYLDFHSPIEKRMTTINLWYPNIGPWCRKCKENHLTRECNKPIIQPPMEEKEDANSYAARLKIRGGGFRSAFQLPSLSATQSKPQNSAQDDLQMVTLNSNDQVFKPPNATTSGQAKESEEYVLFSMKSQEMAFLSNTYPCGLNLDDITFLSTWHYLIFKKALKVGDKKAAKKIQNAKSIEQANDVVTDEWDEKINGDLHTFTNEVLYEANKEKYDGNRELRKLLFETAPKKLALATSDAVWGIGVDLKDPDNGDCSKWKGKNVFGKMLTEIRDSMMASGDYEDEVMDHRQTLFDSNLENRKRGRESTDSDISRESPSSHQNKQLRAESLVNDLTTM